MVRFGEWDNLLEVPEPDKKAVYARAMWHYGRAVAYAKKGMTDKAEEERLAAGPLKDTTLKSISVGALNTPYALMEIADKIISAEIYPSQIKIMKRQFLLLQEAMVMEDNLNYNEPSDWHQPVRQMFGAVLLESGNFKEAEKFYLEDLENLSGEWLVIIWFAAMPDRTGP